MSFISTYIEAAEQHGRDNGAGYELGDLEALLRRAVDLMTAAQKEIFLSGSNVADVVCNAIGACEPDEMQPLLVDRGLALDSADALIAIAKIHGDDSDPDHEAGDLQEFVRFAAEMLTDEQRAAFAANQDVRDVLVTGALADAT